MTLNLSEKQKEIVNFTEGALLVKAGPGSGKTRVLIERIKKLLRTKKRSKILALTFSNLAAEEMRQRLEEDKDIEELIDNVNVGTIHSFALDLVQRRGNLVGLDEGLIIFENTADRVKILRDVFINDSEFSKILKQKDKPEKFLNECLDMIAEQKKKFISPEMCDEESTFSRVYREYNQYLLQQNAMDFDDILFYAYRILIENPSIQNMYASLYKYICVDESQDLNYAQYELIKALCGTKIHNVMFVGDENQSIYGFNGSDSDLMTKSFVNDFLPTIFVLQENFRSAKKIVEYANYLENTDSISNYYYEGELKAYECQNEDGEADFVVSKILDLKEKGHKDIENLPEYDDFAVIARNRYALMTVEKKLEELNIPYFYKRTINGIECESEYVKVFDLALRVRVNENDAVHLKQLCNLVGNNESCSLAEALQDRKYLGIINSLKYMDDDDFQFGKGIKVIKEYVENDTTVFNEDEKYLIIGDLEQWDYHWKKYCSMIPRENRTLLSFRNSISLGKTQAISKDKGVALLTAHMSKGLQYEVVFVVGLTEGTFPDYRAVLAGKKEMEQEKNNMFVAATRAKRLCYFTYPKFKSMPWGDIKIQKKSRFLNKLPIETI